jgi:uncharacterized membrane protein
MDQDSAKSWRATLTPHRSLSRGGFIALMTAVILLNLGPGVYLFSIGAWPVAGFMGLDVALLWWAFRRNYADARIAENIEITEDEVVLERLSEKHAPQEHRFVRRWVRVELEEDKVRELVGPLYLRSSDRRMEIARFLSPPERQAFAHALKAALVNPHS